MAAQRTELWQHATVRAVSSVASAIRRIELEVEQPVPVEPGAHIEVRIAIGDATDRRAYSVVDASEDGVRIAVSVFESATSRGGAAVMHALRPGDRVELTRPMNDFPLRRGAHRYVLLAGGVGVTAILGMAERLRALGEDYRFVYVGRTREAMAYLDRAAEHAERFELHVSDEGGALQVAELVDGIDAGTELYVCGPIRLMDAVRRAWLERGLPLSRLRMETFGNSGWFEAVPFTVRIPAIDLETRVESHQSMLEALESAGADMLFDCRKGECGLCEVRVLELEGDIDHRDVFYSERQRDARSKLCCCVSRVVPAASGSGIVTILTS